MLARTFSCAVVGLDGVIVEVEVDYTNGLPGMTIVEVRGQEHVRRALEVAAAGGHNVLTLWTKNHPFFNRDYPGWSFTGRPAFPAGDPDTAESVRPAKASENLLKQVRPGEREPGRPAGLPCFYL